MHVVEAGVFASELIRIAKVFANLGLSGVGSPGYDAARMCADLDYLDTFYVGGG